MADFDFLTTFFLQGRSALVVGDTYDPGFNMDRFRPWGDVLIIPFLIGDDGTEILIRNQPEKLSIILVPIPARYETGILKLVRQPAPANEIPNADEYEEQEESEGVPLLAETPALELPEGVHLAYRVKHGTMKFSGQTYTLDDFSFRAPQIATTLYTTTVERIDAKPSTNSNIVMRMIPDSYALDSEGNLKLFANGVELGGDVNIDNIVSGRVDELGPDIVGQQLAEALPQAIDAEFEAREPGIVDADEPGLGRLKFGDALSEPFPLSATTWGALNNKPPIVTEFDLWSFLLPEETFPGDNMELDSIPLIHRAIAAINDMIEEDTTGQVFTLNLGPHRFRINSAIDIIGDKPYAKRLKIKGDGRWRTIILPYGPVSAFYPLGAGVTSATPLDFFWFDNCHFEDFTIDARNQTYPEPVTFQKAFVGGGWKECTWTRVNAIGTTATMFGNDFPVRCIMTDCHAINAGRGSTPAGSGPTIYAEARSGFGIGFGHYDDESIDFIGCSAIGCSRSGFFFERQDARATLRREAIIRMTDCEASRNGNGVTDAGCCGVVAVNCKLTDNIGAGFYEGPNTQAKESGLYGRLSKNTIMRNGVGIYMTGSLQTTPADAPVVTGGGYVVEGNRIQDNIGPGLQVKDFWTLEAGGLTVRNNQFIRNGGPGVDMRGCATPARDFALVGNDFDGNGGIGAALMIPMNAPRITDNDFFNSDGVARQVDAIMFHPAEPVTLPRVQRNTYRRHSRTLVNSTRLDQTNINSNIVVAPGNDPGTAALYDEYLQSKPDATAATLGPGWNAAPIGTPDWQRITGGTRPNGGTWGRLAIQYRDLGQNNIYAAVTLPLATQVGGMRFRGVALAVSGDEAVIAGVDDVSDAFGAPSHYAMWKVINGIPTLLWESAVPGTEAHTVALARKVNSTVTTLFIDGVALHTRDIPDVPVSNNAGVAAASGVAGTSGSTPSVRLIRRFRAVSAGDIEEAPIITGTVRNMATNPSFEVNGGFTSQYGTGGAGTASRQNNPSEARSGNYSYLLTWTTATTDPVLGGGRITTIEDVTVGKRYTCSVWVKSSAARKYRLKATYYNASGATGTSTGFTDGAYSDVAEGAWTRLTITTGVIPAETVSLRIEVAAASLAAGGTNFAVGDTLRIDDYMVTEGTGLYDFFSGDVNGGTWVGAANASASTKVVPI